jgi:hypothetical protein
VGDLDRDLVSADPSAALATPGYDPTGGESAPGRVNLAEKKEEREGVAGVLRLCQSQDLPLNMACFDYLVGCCV